MIVDLIVQDKLRCLTKEIDLLKDLHVLDFNEYRVSLADSYQGNQ